jgi:cytochrome c oxidase assembly protein subunit 15
MELGATKRETPREAFGWTTALIWISGLQMALGALVAGLDAGRGYTDWPLMSGQVVPPEMWSMNPFWLNFVENPATAQFVHRLVAYALLGLALWAAWKYRAQHWSLFRLFAGLVLAQAVLGVVTLVNAAPLDLSLLHQALGTIVLLAATRLVWTAKPAS